MKYRKFDKAMQKSSVEYNMEETNIAILIETDPDKNEIAQKNIQIALGKDETCVNSVPGKFNVIQTEIKVYKTPVVQKEYLES